MRSIPSARRLAGLALLAALVLAGGEAGAEGVLRIGTNVGTVTFDPIRTNANADIWVFNNMNAFLVRANRDATEIIPDLAERWEISDDGLTYTFHLREAKFSDGSPVTSADVAFSLTRLRDDPESAWSDPYQIIEAIDTPDERTVIIRCPSRQRPSSPRSRCSPPRSCRRRWSSSRATRLPRTRSARVRSGSRSGGVTKS